MDIVPNNQNNQSMMTSKLSVKHDSELGEPRDCGTPSRAAKKANYMTQGTNMSTFKSKMSTYHDNSKMGFNVNRSKNMSPISILKNLH